MKIVFVELLFNHIIYNNNIRLIDLALAANRINKEQAKWLYSNNDKWSDTCNHKGLLYIEGNNYYFITRTSKAKLIKLPRTFDEYSNKIPNQKVETKIFNKNCKIIKTKWVLGSEGNERFEYRSLEERQDVIARLVGTQEDLQKFKEWAKKLNLQEYDISPYFNISKTIDELAILNSLNTIKDE